MCPAVAELMPWYTLALGCCRRHPDVPGLFREPGQQSMHEFWWSICRALDSEMVRRMQAEVDARRGRALRCAA